MREFPSRGLPSPKSETRSPSQYTGISSSGNTLTPATPTAKYAKLDGTKTQQSPSTGSCTPSYLPESAFGLPSPQKTPSASSQADSGYAPSWRSSWSSISGRSRFLGLTLSKSQSELAFIDLAVPPPLERRYRDLKLLYSEALWRAVSRNKTKPGDIATKLRYIGESSANAELCVVVYCEKAAAGRVKKFFAQKHVRDDFNPDFKIRIVTAPPVRLAADLATITVHSSDLDIRTTLCGMPIQMTSDSGTAVATLGGLIGITSRGGERSVYGLTAAHSLHGIQPSPQTPSLPDVDSEEDESSSDESSESDDFIQVLEATDPEFGHSCADSIRMSPPPPTAQRHGSMHGYTLHSASSDRGANRDWALVCIPPQDWRPNLFPETEEPDDGGICGKASELLLDSSDKSVDGDGTPDPQLSLPRAAVILTSRGPQRGILSASSSSILLSPGEAFVDTLDFLPSEGSKLQPGDSGSWAVDDASKQVLGHVVSVDIFGEAFVVPIRDTLNDIQSQLGSLLVLLPTKQAIDNLRREISAQAGASMSVVESVPRLLESQTTEACSASSTMSRPMSETTTVVPEEPSIINNIPSTSHKRRLSETEEDDSHDHDDEGRGFEAKPSERGGRKRLKRDAEPYPCPFRKRNPHRFNIRDWEYCAKTPLQGISAVKKHILKYHMHHDLSYRYSRCNTRFPSRDDLGHHQTQEDMCQLRDDDGPADPLVEERAGWTTYEILRNRPRHFTWDSLWLELFPSDKPEDIPAPEFAPPVESHDIVREFEAGLPTLQSVIHSALMESGFQRSAPPQNDMRLVSERLQELVKLHMEDVFHKAQAHSFSEAVPRVKPSPASVPRARPSPAPVLGSWSRASSTMAGIPTPPRSSLSPQGSSRGGGTSPGGSSRSSIESRMTNTNTMYIPGMLKGPLSPATTTSPSTCTPSSTPSSSSSSSSALMMTPYLNTPHHYYQGGGDLRYESFVEVDLVGHGVPQSLSPYTGNIDYAYESVESTAEPHSCLSEVTVSSDKESVRTRDLDYYAPSLSTHPQAFLFLPSPPGGQPEQHQTGGSNHSSGNFTGGAPPSLPPMVMPMNSLSSISMVNTYTDYSKNNPNDRMVFVPDYQRQHQHQYQYRVGPYGYGPSSSSGKNESSGHPYEYPDPSLYTRAGSGPESGPRLGRGSGSGL